MHQNLSYFVSPLSSAILKTTCLAPCWRVVLSDVGTWKQDVRTSRPGYRIPFEWRCHAVEVGWGCTHWGCSVESLPRQKSASAVQGNPIPGLACGLMSCTVKVEQGTADLPRCHSREKDYAFFAYLALCTMVTFSGNKIQPAIELLCCIAVHYMIYTCMHASMRACR